jgi:hypothetical protein
VRSKDECVPIASSDRVSRSHWAFFSWVTFSFCSHSVYVEARGGDKGCTGIVG